MIGKEVVTMHKLSLALLTVSMASGAGILSAEPPAAPTGLKVLSSGVAPSVSGQWQQSGSMSVTRLNFTSTILGGQVLVTGGDSLGPTILASAEMYNPNTRRWSLI